LERNSSADLLDQPAAWSDPAIAGDSSATAEPARCFHCGTRCRGEVFTLLEKSFCCQGCKTVFEILSENGLNDFYSLSENAGVRVKRATRADQFSYLDAPAVLERLVNFTNGKLTRITFHIPSMHCIACVWLLENLFRLKAGIGQSQVNFPRKELSLSFENEKVKLSEVVGLLAALGYEPELKFSDLENHAKKPVNRRLWLQMGIAGFAFGNIMLFSISAYLGLDSFSGPGFKKLVGYISLFLALPVVTYSAWDYWRSSIISLRQKLLTIDVPIAAGILAIYAQSAYEVLSGVGEGYFDSLCGLIFFLLCGRLFQQKTYDRLAFDRDYKSFFPLSVTRIAHGTEETAALAQVETGDHLLVRNGELIPADARLVSGAAVIDYSFVTGESEPVEKQAGDHLYAGGRQMGGAIEIETVKAVSQSYLTSLWNQEAFRKENSETLATLTNIFSERFTRIVIAIAAGSAVFWWPTSPALAIKAFTSVLIVACPCALALAAPFTLGTALRALGKRNIFVKSPVVLETLARVTAVVFDKTGTLTAAGAGSIRFEGNALNDQEKGWVFSLSRHSTHPYAVRISEALAEEQYPQVVRSFLETTGCGIEANIGSNEIWMGSAAWLATRNVAAPKGAMKGSHVHLAINGTYRGCFVLASALREETEQLIGSLRANHQLALLSGDNDKDRAKFQALFGTESRLAFNQSPVEKLAFIRSLQGEGNTVMMVGDGLNDAGALKQSDVGVAVVERISAFSPASDIIVAAGAVPKLAAALKFSKGAVRIVRVSFLISGFYNVIGIAIAASGSLSPIVCAILMPLSSVSVVGFACGATAWLGRRSGLGEPSQFQSKNKQP